MVLGTRELASTQSEAASHARLERESQRGTRERLRRSVADLFKKFSGSVQSSGRPPGLPWDTAKSDGNEA